MNIKFELKCNFVVFKLDISNLFEFLIHFMPKKLRKEEIDIWNLIFQLATDKNLSLWTENLLKHKNTSNM